MFGNGNWGNLLLFLVLPLLGLGRTIESAEDGDRTISPPYVFNLGGLSDLEQKQIQQVPGVESAHITDGRLRVTWQPYNNELWDKGKKWIQGSERIYDFLALKAPLGNTKWTHGRNIARPAGTIILQTRSSVCFGMMFDDRKTGHNEIMFLNGFCEALPGQIEHEMLRRVAGAPNVVIEKCGNGYVIVEGVEKNYNVRWLVSDQLYVLIGNSFDKKMVAAYVERLGSIIPKDYQISVNKWVENEVRWRFKQLDFAYDWDSKGHNDGVATYAQYVTMMFPDVYNKKGLLEGGRSIAEIWTWINWTRNFLWANRANFKYDSTSGGYILKGNDLFDPEHPPELPEDLRGAAKPTVEQIEQTSPKPKEMKPKPDSTEPSKTP